MTVKSHLMERRIVCVNVEKNMMRFVEFALIRFLWRHIDTTPRLLHEHPMKKMIYLLLASFFISGPTHALGTTSASVISVAAIMGISLSEILGTSTLHSCAALESKCCCHNVQPNTSFVDIKCQKNWEDAECEARNRYCFDESRLKVFPIKAQVSVVHETWAILTSMTLGVVAIAPWVFVVRGLLCESAPIGKRKKFE